MKRGIGILVLAIISLALLYAPQSETTTPLGLSCAKKPIPQQPTTQLTSGQPVSGFCFSLETQEIIPATTPTQEVPVDYYYENIRTLGWRFNVDSEGARVKGPELKILSKTITLPLWAVEASGSDQNCKYYSFLYQRQVQTFNFDLPFTKTEFSDYDGDGKDERICYYSTEPIARDLLEIAALSGQLDIDLNNPCPEIRGKPIESDQPCSQAEQCSIHVPRGEIQYFGFTFEKDACGNRLVKVDNNGQAIRNNDLKRQANTFLVQCKQKYTATQPRQPEPECPTDEIDLGRIYVEAHVDVVEADVDPATKTLLWEKKVDDNKRDIAITKVTTNAKFVPTVDTNGKKLMAPQFETIVDYQKKEFEGGTRFLGAIFGFPLDDLYLANFKVVKGIQRKLSESGLNINLIPFACEREGVGCKSVAVTLSNDPQEIDNEARLGSVSKIENQKTVIKLWRLDGKNYLEIQPKNGNFPTQEISDQSAIEIFRRFVTERDASIDKSWETIGRLGVITSENKNIITIFSPTFAGDGKTILKDKWKRITITKNIEGRFNEERKQEILNSACIIGK